MGTWRRQASGDGHRYHAIRINVIDFPDLLSHILRIGMNPGSSTDGGSHRLSMAKSTGHRHRRVELEPDVVDRHHRGSPARWGDQIVGSMNNVYPTSEPLHTGNRDSAPQPTDNPRREPPRHLPDHSTNVIRQPVASHPSRGERRHLQIWVRAQFFEQLSGEGADTGTRHQQGRGIDSQLHSKFRAFGHCLKIAIDRAHQYAAH